MEKTQAVGTEPTFFVRDDKNKSWEERVITRQKQTGIGWTALRCLREQRFYQYTDAAASAILIIDHFLR